MDKERPIYTLNPDKIVGDEHPKSWDDGKIYTGKP